MSTKSELARLRKAVAQKSKILSERQTKRRVHLPPPEPYRSWFEVDVAVDALERGIEFEYEAHHIVWIEPEKVRKYKPDFFVKRKKDGSLLIVEGKGRWTASDRKKMCYVTEQNPELDIRILFERDNTLSKSPKSAKYSEWCEKKGLKYAIGRSIPEEWLNE